MRSASVSVGPPPVVILYPLFFMVTRLCRTYVHSENESAGLSGCTTVHYGILSPLCVVYEAAHQAPLPGAHYLVCSSSPPLMTSVLVTHATAGVGLAVARAFAAMPNVNIMIHHSPDTAAAEIHAALDHVRRSMRGSGRVLAAPAQLIHQQDATDLVENIRRELGGRLDVCVSWETLRTEHFKVLPVEGITVQHWSDVVEHPLRAALNITQAALRPMKAQGFGRLVHVTGAGATMGRPYAATLAAGRHALLGVVRSAAAEVGGDGVTINALSVGLWKGPEFEALVSHRMASDGEDREACAQSVMCDTCPSAPRFVELDEIAAACVFLALPTSRSINGSVLSLDAAAAAAAC